MRSLMAFFAAADCGPGLFRAAGLAGLERMKAYWAKKKGSPKAAKTVLSFAKTRGRSLSADLMRAGRDLRLAT